METRVMKLCCQGCGADLQVTEDLRFVTCNYCQSKLEIVRDASVTHTRVLEKLEKTAERLAGNLRVIELQNDLERMDREWESIRKGMMSRGRYGELYEPSMGGSIILGIGAAVLGVALVCGSLFSAQYLASLFGFGVLAFGIWVARNEFHKAQDYDSLQKRYEAHRQRVLGMIEKARRR